MEYVKNYTVNKEHVDVHGLMYSTYYPYYMELCRRDYIKEKLGFDFAEEASRDIYMKVSQYSIKSLGILKSGDSFTVSCSIYIGSDEKQNFKFKQSIVRDDTIIALGMFSVNCVMISKEKPYIRSI